MIILLNDFLYVFKTKQFWVDLIIVSLSILLSVCIVNVGLYLSINPLLVFILSVAVGSFYMVKMLILDTIKYFKLMKQPLKTEQE